MYPRHFSPDLAKQFFDYYLLEKEYSKWIPIIQILSYSDNEKISVFDISKAASEFDKKAPKDKSALLLFDIPSPLGSQTDDGRTLIHVVSALVDNEKKRIYLQEPLYGVTGEKNIPCSFPTDLISLLKRHYPEFEIKEHAINVQQKGENICKLAAIMRAKSFVEDPNQGGSLTRQQFEKNYSQVMEFLNKNIIETNKNLCAGMMLMALRSEIKLALMKKYGIHIAKPSDQREFVLPISADDSDRGKLSQSGTQLVDHIVNEIYRQYPALIIPISAPSGSSPIHTATHVLDKNFTVENSKELANDIRTFITTNKAYNHSSP